MKIKNNLKPVLDAAFGMLVQVFPDREPKELYRKLLTLGEDAVQPRAVSHDPRGYSPAEAAKLSSMSRRTIFRYIHNGRLKAKKIGPRLVRIPKDEMEKLLSINPAVFNNAPAESADGEARS